MIYVLVIMWIVMWYVPMYALFFTGVQNVLIKICTVEKLLLNNFLKQWKLKSKIIHT